MTEENPNQPRGLARIEVISFAAACVWIVAAWFWAIHDAKLWIGVDDILRMRHVQYLQDGVLPIEWGGEWLPGVMFYQAVFGAIMPHAVPHAVMLSSLVGYLTACYFARRTALLLSGPSGGFLVSIGFALSKIGLRLTTSAESEPIFLACLLGGGWFLAKAIQSESRRALIAGVVLFAAAEIMRVEGWAAALTCCFVIAIGSAAEKKRDRANQFARAFLILCIVPAFWMFAAFLAHGNPLHAFMNIAHMHAGYFEKQPPWAHLVRLVTYYASGPVGLHILSVAGMIAVALSRREATLPPLLAALACYWFLIATAIGGTFSPLALDRFVANPVLLSLPFAGCALQLIGGRFATPLKAALVAGFFILSIVEFRQFNFDEEKIRQDMRLDFVNEVRATNGQLAHPKKKARNIYAMPQPPADIVINAMLVFRPEENHKIAWVDRESSAVDLVHLAESKRANRLIVEPRLSRAIFQFHDWYRRVHTLGEEPPVAGWEPVRFADGVFLVLRTAPYDEKKSAAPPATP